jgi:hypothetical protein
MAHPLFFLFASASMAQVLEALVKCSGGLLRDFASLKNKDQSSVDEICRIYSGLLCDSFVRR